MPARNLLHKRDVADFRKWLEANGHPTRDTTADWQLFQVRWGSGWMPIFERLRMPEHVTVPDALYGVVRKFLNSKRTNLEPSHAPQASNTETSADPSRNHPARREQARLPRGEAGEGSPATDQGSAGGQVSPPW